MTYLNSSNDLPKKLSIFCLRLDYVARLSDLNTGSNQGYTKSMRKAVKHYGYKALNRLSPPYSKYDWNGCSTRAHTLTWIRPDVLAGITSRNAGPHPSIKFPITYAERTSYKGKGQRQDDTKSEEEVGGIRFSYHSIILWTALLSCKG